MDNLKRFFPECKLSNEEIREVIKQIVGLDDIDICYKCCKYIGKSNKNSNCKSCFQVYCESCTSLLICHEPIKARNREIDTAKCPQCKENSNQMSVEYL